jgi:propanediol dehydratase small subunit
MSALEQDLFDKIRKLDEQNKLRVLEFVNGLQPNQVSWDEWLKVANELHAELVARYGENHFFNSTDVLREVRGYLA